MMFGGCVCVCVPHINFVIFDFSYVNKYKNIYTNMEYVSLNCEREM